MRFRPALSAVIAFSLLTSACTLDGPRRKTDANGYQTTTTYACDWKPGSFYLWRGEVPNSPFIPFTRSNARIPWFQKVIFVVPFMLDLVLSPIAYSVARDCKSTGVSTQYVGTPESRKRDALAAAEAEKQRKLRDSDEYKRREAAEAAARLEREKAEAEKRRVAESLEREYPPLDEYPKSFTSPRPKDFALIVGIETYRSIPKADYGETDAKRMRAWVEALGVPPSNVIMLTGAGASKSDIAKYLEEWLPANVSSDSRVYFYWSGHGAPDPATGSAYLVPWDGDPAFPKSTAYPVSKIFEALEKLPNKESVVMLDSCFSGSGGRSVLAPGARPLVAVREDAVPASGKVSVLAASGPDEIAGGLGLRRQGLFSYFVLRGLSGAADADGDKSVTLGELRTYLTAEVPKAANRGNRRQTPRVVGADSFKLY